MNEYSVYRDPSPELKLEHQSRIALLRDAKYKSGSGEIGLDLLDKILPLSEITRASTRRKNTGRGGQCPECQRKIWVRCYQCHPQTEKVCSICLKMKTAEEFHIHGQAADGLNAACKPCRNAVGRMYVRRKPKRKEAS